MAATDLLGAGGVTLGRGVTTTRLTLFVAGSKGPNVTLADQSMASLNVENWSLETIKIWHLDLE